MATFPPPITAIIRAYTVSDAIQHFYCGEYVVCINAVQTEFFTFLCTDGNKHCIVAVSYFLNGNIHTYICIIVYFNISCGKDCIHILIHTVFRESIVRDSVH